MEKKLILKIVAGIFLFILVIGGSVYFFRKDITYVLVESRLNEYVERSPNSNKTKNRVRELISPTIHLVKYNELTQSEMKIVGNAFVSLKNNVDIANIGVPLSDQEVESICSKIQELLIKYKVKY